jgi:uncharacterized protein YlxP (DUF503 family)
MVVSMLLVIIEIPDLTSLKDKRRVVHSVRDRVNRKFRVSVAEVDLEESISFSQLGVAVVSNDKIHGERVIHGVLEFIEKIVPGRIQEVQTHSESYD